VDGTGFDGEARVLRDRYFGINPVNVIFSLEQMITLPTACGQSAPDERASCASSDMLDYIRGLPLEAGFSSVSGLDDATYNAAVSYDGFTSVARLLRTGVEWSGLISSYDAPFDDTVIQYDGRAFNLTCLQRLFSIQVGMVSSPSYDEVIVPPSRVARGKRARRVLRCSAPTTVDVSSLPWDSYHI
jgi:hypothetical protein